MPGSVFCYSLPLDSDAGTVDVTMSIYIEAEFCNKGIVYIRSKDLLGTQQIIKKVGAYLGSTTGVLSRRCL